MVSRPACAVLPYPTCVKLLLTLLPLWRELADVERLATGEELGALPLKLGHRHGKIVSHWSPPLGSAMSYCTLENVQVVRSSTYSRITIQSNTQR